MKSDALASTLIANAADGIAAINASRFVQVYNAACESLLGCRIDEVIAHNTKMLKPRSHQAEHDAYSANQIDPGRAQVIRFGREAVGKCQDSTAFPMHLSIGKGKIDSEAALAETAQTLTERKLSDALGHQREAQLCSILATLPDAIVTIDEYRFLESFSTTISRSFEYGLSQVVEKNVSMFMPSRCRAYHDGNHEHYCRTGELNVMGSARIGVGQRRDGSTFPMELVVGGADDGVRRLFRGLRAPLLNAKEICSDSMGCNRNCFLCRVSARWLI